MGRGRGPRLQADRQGGLQAVTAVVAAAYYGRHRVVIKPALPFPHSVLSYDHRHLSTTDSPIDRAHCHSRRPTAAGGVLVMSIGGILRVDWLKRTLSCTRNPACASRARSHTRLERVPAELVAARTDPVDRLGRARRREGPVVGTAHHRLSHYLPLPPSCASSCSPSGVVAGDVASSLPRR